MDVWGRPSQAAGRRCGIEKLCTEGRAGGSPAAGV